MTFDKLGKVLRGDDQVNTMGVWDPEKYQVEDSAFGFFVMKNGALIYLKAYWALNIVESAMSMVTLCGIMGGLDSDDDVRVNHIVVGKQAVTKLETQSPFGGGFIHPRARVMNPNAQEATHWVNSLMGRGELFVKPEQAFTVTRILDVVYQSVMTGKTVTFD